MAKQLTDDELNLRRKARRRLIGAAALTLAVVVILPMVLDREPGPTGKNIDLNIPSPEKAGAFNPASPVSAVAAAVQRPAASAVVATQLPLPGNDVAAPSQPNEEKKPQAATVEPPSPVKPSPQQPSAGSGKPGQAENGGQQGAKAYVAQVGAYSNAAAAKQEYGRLRKWGFKVYIEKSGDKARVRVGPYADRAKAEKAASLLEKHGLKPVVLSADK
jgi:DedD protein